MRTTVSDPAAARPLSTGPPGGVRYVLGAAALGVITVAAARQWGWLVTIGAAPLPLSVAPCAAMWGVGLCMRRMGGRRSMPAKPGGQAVRATLENLPATKER